MRIGHRAVKSLRASDLDKPRLISVSLVEENLYGRLELRCDEFENPIPLSQEGLGQLISIFGTDETNEWIGQYVVVFNDRNVEYDGRKVGGIRFRPVKEGFKVPETAKKSRVIVPAAAPADDDVPF